MATNSISPSTLLPTEKSALGGLTLKSFSGILFKKETEGYTNDKGDSVPAGIRVSLKHTDEDLGDVWFGLKGVDPESVIPGALVIVTGVLSKNPGTDKNGASKMYRDIAVVSIKPVTLDMFQA